MKRLALWIAGLVGRSRFERELSDELAFHLHERSEHWRRQGLEPEEARRRARLEFGNVEHVKENVRETRFGAWFEQTRQDLRNALRTLRRSPGFTVTVVLVLALGIGATGTIFTVVDAVLVRPLPHPDPDRLVRILLTFPGGGSRPPGAELLAAWREHSTSLEGVDRWWGAYNINRYALSGDGESVWVENRWVGPGFFDVLGGEPFLGRTFAADHIERNQSNTVVLSHDFWRDHFGADREILGKTLEIQHRARTVIGVMPAGFRVDPLLPSADVWMATEGDASANRMYAIGRLRASVSVEQAQSELDGIMQGVIAGLESQGLEPNGVGARWPEGEDPRVTLRGFGEGQREWFHPALSRLSGLVGFVLLICCVNVAGLLLARGATRQRELATRRALGAGRARLVREALVETLLLGLLGGAAGVLVTYWGIQLFLALGATGFREMAPESFGLDLKVLGFVAAVSLAAGVLAGLVPALRASATGVMGALKESAPEWRGRRSRSLGTGSLIVGEVAIAVVLLVGTGLTINSVTYIANLDWGFNPERLAKMNIRVQGSEYRMEEPETLRVTPQVAIFYQRLLDRLAAHPGVESVGLINGFPRGGLVQVPFRIIGRPVRAEEQREQRAVFKEVSPDVFRTMGVPLLKGRDFAEQDDEGAPRVAIIDEEMARQFFPGEDPIGKFLHADLTGGVSHPDLVGDEPRAIVGIVGSTKYSPEWAPPKIYVPFRQHLAVYPAWAVGGLHLVKDVVIRTSSDPDDLLATMREAVAQVDSNQLPDAVMTVDDALAGVGGDARFWMRFLMICGGVAVVLAALGLYAVIAQAVAQRTHELGVRMALGAQKADVRRQVLRQGLALALLGVAVGVAAALGLTRFADSLLVGVSPLDPVAFGAAALVMVGVALLASYLPARRATEVDAVIALRQQ